MYRILSKNFLLGLSGVMVLLASSSTFAVSGAGMKACENAKRHEKHAQ